MERESNTKPTKAWNGRKIKSPKNCGEPNENKATKGCPQQNYRAKSIWKWEWKKRRSPKNMEWL